MKRKDREITDLIEIKKIIREADVCRLALYDGKYPYLVTMNFGYKPGKPDRLYFHYAKKGKKIDIIKKNNKVCFAFNCNVHLIKLPKACDYGMVYKSVVGFGKIFIVENQKERIEGLNQIMKQYSDDENFIYDQKILNFTMILRIDIESLNGKKKIH